MPRVNFVGSSALFATVQTNGYVTDAVLVGSLLYVAGYFTAVTDRNGASTRNNGACLNLSTGLWTAFDAGLDSGSACVESDGTYVYYGGVFTVVAGAPGVSYLTRFLLATGAVDPAWIPAPSDSLLVQSLKYIGGRLYVSGNISPFNYNGSTRYGLASFTGGVLDSWTPYPTFGGSGNIYNIVDVGGGNIGLAGDFHYYQNVTLTRYLGFNFVTVNATTGAVNQCANGYRRDSAGGGDTGALVIGSQVYLGGDTGVGVYDEPLDTINASSRTGWYACDLSGTWSSTWNPSITDGGAFATSSTRAMAQVGSQIILAGRFTGADNTQCALLVDATTGARDSGFSLTYSAFLSSSIEKALVYGSMLILLGNIGNTVNGRYCNSMVFADATTGALLP